MRNVLTFNVETRIGVVVIIFWATLFTVVVLRAVSNFQNFLVILGAETPRVQSIARIEHNQINRWLAETQLNLYGDPPDTVYAGGTPLFDEETGKLLDRYTYLVQKFPEKPWKKNL